MSMKRSKQRSSGSGRYSSRDDDPAPWNKPEGPEPAWAEIDAKPAEAFVPFALTSKYAKGDLLLHSKFGKGIVIAVEGTRIEVLFQDGKKKLGHMAT